MNIANENENHSKSHSESLQRFEFPLRSTISTTLNLWNLFESRREEWDIEGWRWRRGGGIDEDDEWVKMNQWRWKWMMNDGGGRIED